MSSFSRGISDVLGIASLAQQMDRAQAYEQMRRQEMDARRRAEQRALAEHTRRQQMDNATRAVWLEQIDQLGGFGGLGSQQVGVPGPGPLGPGPAAGDHGPFTQDQQIAQTFNPQTQGSVLGTLSRELLASADPAAVRELATTMLREREGVRKMQTQARMDFDEWQRTEMQRRARRATVRTQMQKLGLPQELIEENLTKLDLAEADVPQGIVQGMFPGPQPYQPTAEDFMALGVPGGQPSAGYGPFQPGQEPAMGGPAAALARMGASPTEAARFIPEDAAPGAQPEQVLATFGGDLGPKVVQFQRLLEIGMAPTHAWDVAAGENSIEDLNAAAGISKRLTQMSGDRVKQLQATIASLYDNWPKGHEPEVLALQQAQQEYEAAARQEQELLTLLRSKLGIGDAQQAPRDEPARDPAQSDPAQANPANINPENRQLARRMAQTLFPDIPPEQLSPEQKQILAEYLGQLKGGSR